MKVRLSVVTVNLNNADGLRKTMDSVLSQTIFSEIEYIVIDGASTDGSVEEIRERSKDLKFWCSEKDSGVYNAMNKGIANCTGDYILFLNSGDHFLEENTVEKALEGANEDIIYGFIESPRGVQTSLERLTTSALLKISLHHQATFIKRELFERFGTYAEDNKFESDWEFFLKCILVEKVKVRRYPHPVSFFEMGGLSSNERLEELKMLEKIKVVQRVLPDIAELYQDYLSARRSLKELQRRNLGFLFRMAWRIENSMPVNIIKKWKKK